MSDHTQGERYSSDEMQGIWTTFQQTQEARCPACDGRVEVTLSSDPATDGADEAAFRADCTNCGRTGEDRPGSHTDFQGWLD